MRLYKVYLRIIRGLFKRLHGLFRDYIGFRYYVTFWEMNMEVSQNLRYLFWGPPLQGL